MADDDKRVGLSVLERGIGLALAALSAVAAYQASIAKDKVAEQALEIDQLKVEVAKTAEERETRRLNHEITIKIFDEVKAVYDDVKLAPERQLNRLLAVVALIEAIPDPAVRSSLATSVRTAADNISATLSQPNTGVANRIEAVKNKLDESVFKADSDVARTLPVNSGALKQAAQASTIEKPRWEGYDLDFFWCERGPDPEASRRAAELAASLRQLDPAASGRWRVRMLPTTINQRPGYSIGGYQINVTSKDEEQLGEVLEGVMRARGIPSADANWIIKHVGSSTPWYISVFFCEGALVN